MSSKIEMPRKLAMQILESMNGQEQWLAGEEELALLLAASVVERQPINQCDGCRSGKPLVHGNLHVMINASGYQDIMACTAHLYSAPPELAELQATIARLESEAVYAAAGFQTAKDEIERLKGGQGEPVACAHEWTDDGEFTLVCTKCGLQENHEPYGWVQTHGNAINDFTQEWDVVQEWEDHGFEYKAMFDHASQPAPVSVVLPERKEYPDAPAQEACLDKVKELNQ